MYSIINAFCYQFDWLFGKVSIKKDSHAFKYQENRAPAFISSIKIKKGESIKEIITFEW